MKVLDGMSISFFFGVFSLVSSSSTNVLCMCCVYALICAWCGCVCTHMLMCMHVKCTYISDWSCLLCGSHYVCYSKCSPTPLSPAQYM
jgi:hypothetical protein